MRRQNNWSITTIKQRMEYEGTKLPNDFMIWCLRVGYQLVE